MKPSLEMALRDAGQYEYGLLIKSSLAYWQREADLHYSEGIVSEEYKVAVRERTRAEAEWAALLCQIEYAGSE